MSDELTATPSRSRPGPAPHSQLIRAPGEPRPGAGAWLCTCASTLLSAHAAFISVHGPLPTCLPQMLVIVQCFWLLSFSSFSAGPSLHPGPGTKPPPFPSKPLIVPFLASSHRKSLQQDLVSKGPSIQILHASLCTASVLNILQVFARLERCIISLNMALSIRLGELDKDHFLKLIFKNEQKEILVWWV